ncbi:Pre-mRNA-splicing factor-like protein [Hapsidospora chrysogenum ATCC 11550]|uniref:Pre-mRNA-splicing factor-like protein n=1 Tax=Hapsidospora chrysogenum (strain ATCC 11550 / CBS 779.69 / DSM 880 / IAM 14645 / JCM 23072 / IMI 49137) TaxID=857340 RepID=A0A086TDP5_HAPC1|nr:Pre-mRNA-splicing factor-like protein [Hapsidospora chrysogenum ATCC 11550]
MTGRRDFLSQPAPENYVAGLGRGATGFTTRSDLGPARDGPSEDQIKEALAKRAVQLGLAPDKKKGKEDDTADDDDRYQDPDNETGLFAGGVYDKDDEEADKIWEWVDERMDRRRRQREAREKAEREEYERNNPKIQQQFTDLKRALANVTDDEWANLPEVGDLTGKNRRSKQQLRQRFYAVPDSVLAAARDANEMTTTVADDGMASSADRADGTMTNFAQIGAARDKVLKSRLEQASQSGGGDSVSGSSTSVDPQGYITSLNKMQMSEGLAQVGDINRVRELLQSVVKTNPNNALGWIAAARLEELAGKIVSARKTIDQGCQRCPKSEDAWLENIRLNHDSHNAKVIARRAIEANNRSVRLWVEAMRLENLPANKKRVIRQALDYLPESEALWKEAVNLEEDPEDARLMLAKATELIPLSVDLWLALARLETPENAQKVLNKARKAVPTSYEVWIAAARLQEQLGQGNKVNVMKRAVQVLAKESAMPKREEWIAEAEKCEEEGATVTCGNIIRETLGWGLDEDDDRKDTWMEDARASINRGKYETARAIYAYALRVFVNSKTMWTAAADLERNHGTRESLWQVLEKAVEACPKSEDLWMMLAKEKWQAGEVDGARLVLKRAFNQNPNNEDIWLAAVKLESESGNEEQARKLLEIAREQAPTDRVWTKSVVFERVLGNTETALDLVLQALQLFPSAAKLWMLKGQIYVDLGKMGQARDAYATGVKAVPKSVPLWLLYSRLEEKAGLTVKARSVLDRARLAVPKNPELWCESVRLERRAGNMAQAKSMMAKALQEVPKSGLLWVEQIWHLEPRTQRKPRSLEAIKKVDSDPVLFVAVARIFWGDRKLDKAQSWFEKALVLDSDQGDSWAWYYRFLCQHGTEEKRADVVTKCVLNEPRHGEVWQTVAKDPKNARKGTEEILKLVAAELEE